MNYTLITSNRFNDGGFTFVEVIVYLAITLAMYSIMNIGLGSLEKRKLYLEAKEVKLALNEAQDLAMLKGNNVLVRFNVSDNFYTIIDDVGDYETLRMIVVKDPVYIKLVNTSSNNRTVHYTYRGTVSSGATIQMQTPRYSIDITVSVATGRVKIGEIIKKKGT